MIIEGKILDDEDILKDESFQESTCAKLVKFLGRIFGFSILFIILCNSTRF